MITSSRRLFNIKNRGDSQSERRPGHQVCNDALMGLAFVYLPELLLIVHFDADSVLEHVLDMLALLHLASAFAFNRYNFLEV